MVKHINEPYTNSKIVKEGALAVIQNRADTFFRQVEEKDGYMDVYVSSSLLYHKKQQTVAITVDECC
jgi:hypothetical protein